MVSLPSDIRFKKSLWDDFFYTHKMPGIMNVLFMIPGTAVTLAAMLIAMLTAMLPLLVFGLEHV
jgi:hypothetical protein